jgi:hypothetical protein
MTGTFLSDIKNIALYDFYIVKHFFDDIIPITLIIYNSLVIYYLYNLEDESCKETNCSRDWRHNTIKLFSIITILTMFISLIYFNSDLLYYKFKYNIIYIIFSTFIYILSIINLYALFTYIYDINKNNCKCATEKQPILNLLLIERSYVSVFVFIINTIYYLK